MPLVFRSACASVVAALAAQVMAGAGGSGPPERTLSCRLAEADASRKLVAAIRALQINDDVCAGDLVARDPGARTGIEEYICEISFSEPVWQPDRACTVSAEVPLADVVTRLEVLCRGFIEADVVTAESLATMVRGSGRGTIKVVGFGVPRQDLPPGVPGCVIDRMAAPPAVPDPPVPGLWQNIPAAVRRQAQEAARYDAVRRLAEQIKAFRIGSAATIRDVAVASEEITRRASRPFVAAAPTVARVWYHHDVPILVTAIEIPGRVVGRAVEELCAQPLRESGILRADVRDLVRSLEAQTFRATGTGGPDKRFLKSFNVSSGAAGGGLPEWAMSAVRATGTASLDGQAQGPTRARLLAARAAEADARRSLMQAAAGLEAAPGVRLGELTARHEALLAHLEGILIDAVVEKTAFSDAGATVTISVNGLSVWQIVHEWLRFGGR